MTSTPRLKVSVGARDEENLCRWDWLPIEVSSPRLLDAWGAFGNLLGQSQAGIPGQQHYI